MSDTGTTEEIKPWTIKGITPEIRNAATAAAGRENMNIGEWLSRAIRTQVQEDHSRGRSPAVVGKQELSPPVVPAIVDLDTLERLVGIADKASSSDMPDNLKKSFHAQVRRGLKDMKGAAPAEQKAA